jgi:hypothetical protein
MTSKTKTTLDFLLEKLRYHEIKYAIAYFDGSGDSGCVSSVHAKTIDDVELSHQSLETIVFTDVANEDLSHTYFDDSYLGGAIKPRDFKKKPLTLVELVVDVAELLLETKHAGWEIDAGAYGHITFTPLAQYHKTDPVVIDFNENYNDHDDYESEEYNDN